MSCPNRTPKFQFNQCDLLHNSIIWMLLQAAWLSLLRKKAEKAESTNRCLKIRVGLGCIEQNVITWPAKYHLNRVNIKLWKFWRKSFLVTWLPTARIFNFSCYSSARHERTYPFTVFLKSKYKRPSLNSLITLLKRDVCNSSAAHEDSKCQGGEEYHRPRQRPEINQTRPIYGHLIFSKAIGNFWNLYFQKYLTI